METMNSEDHAKILYRDMLTELRNLRQARALYAATVGGYEDELKAQLGVDKLDRAHQRMASFRADHDDNVKIARGRTEFYTGQVQTLALAYLVEVDFMDRFDAGFEAR